MLVLLDCVGPDALVLVGVLVDEKEDETVEEVKVCEDDVVVWLAVDIKENAFTWYEVFLTKGFWYIGISLQTPLKIPYTHYNKITRTTLSIL